VVNVILVLVLVATLGFTRRAFIDEKMHDMWKY